MKKSSVIFFFVCFFIGVLMSQVSNTIESNVLFRIAFAVIALSFLSLIVKQIIIAFDSKKRIKAFGKRKFFREFYIIIFAAADFLFVICVGGALGNAPSHNSLTAPDSFAIGSMLIAAIMFFSIKYLGIAARKQRIENKKMAVA